MLRIEVPEETPILTAARTIIAAAALACAAWTGPAASAGEPTPGTVRGFVSGGLLNAWCTRAGPLDVEACFSYLRGVFDSLSAMDSASPDHPGGGVDLDCIPDRVSVTELRTVLRRYVAGHPESVARQGSVVVLEAWAENYECGG